MASAVGLNMKFTADTGGIKTGTKEVGKLLNSLGSSISKASGSLSELGASNTAAAAAQQQLATDVAFLGSALRTGQLTAEQFKEEMEALSKAATDQAAAFKRGEAVIRANMTAEERHAQQLEELEDLLRQGAIDTNQFQRAQDRLASQFNEVDKEGSQTNSMLKKMAGNLRILTAIEVGRVLTDAFRSVASAIGGMVSNVTQSVGELTRLASVANTSVTQFQGLATAAATVGIEQDKFADILKDVGDRVGDFLQTGGGPMADFFENIAPKVGVTAEQFKNLSGPDALQLYVDSLEKAGLSQAEMTFYLEAMSSDLTALQPLLAQGGAGMDALAERAERLGIVLSEDQTAAIKEMNGALGLVYDTFEGIIGQVTANLAPIVTQISEEFLSFVESFQGFGGGGGSGIADALTQGLLDFAEFMADIFDSAIEQLLSFGATMEGVSAIFNVVANTFVAVSETFRSLWNVLETIVDGFRAMLGWFLEKLGSWVSSDLEAAGRQIREDAMAAAGKNAAQAAEAAVNAANAALGDRNFGQEGESGILGKAVADVRARLERGAEAGEPASGADQAAEDAKKAQETAAADVAAAQAKAAEDAKKAAEKEEAARKKAAEEALKAEEKRQKEILDVRNKYAEMSYDMEVERLDKLAANTNKALEVSDIRSGGISSFLALATGREDPSVQEARKQVRKLEEIKAELRALGGTVQIVGAV